MTAGTYLRVLDFPARKTARETATRAPAELAVSILCVAVDLVQLFPNNAAQPTRNLTVKREPAQPCLSAFGYNPQQTPLREHGKGRASQDYKDALTGEVTRSARIRHGQQTLPAFFRVSQVRYKKIEFPFVLEHCGEVVVAEEYA